PIAMRLTVFVTPLLAVLVSVGLVAAARGVRLVLASVREGVVVAAVLVPSLMVGISWIVRTPGDHQGLRELGPRLERQRSPGEPLCLFHRVSAEWVYYSTDWRQPDRARLAWAARVAGPDGPGFVNAPPHGPRQAGDGDDLVYRAAGGDELFGL